ncbi:MAG: GNAT family N-acetyltransferase [Alphaproteobacteria bacterium]|nr:GNAT family N-acetyltransferase [Alphaproteobacteria bacterium]
MSTAVDTMGLTKGRDAEGSPAPDISEKAKPAPAKARDMGEVLVPARFDEIDAVHKMVMDAVRTSPYYCDDFKAYESARLTHGYLAQLLGTDPRHVMTLRENGELAGFILSGPEFGVLWQYWSYLDPAHRSGTLAMRVMRHYQTVWQNDRFHKILTYSRPENKVSIALMERYGYKRVAELKQHLFGEDYLLYEYPLNKTKPDYDRGISAGIVAGLRYRLARMLPFRGR